MDNSPRSPLWSYKLGLDNDWIPRNPRDAFVRVLVLYCLPIWVEPSGDLQGTCASLGVAQDSPFNGTYQAYQTGGPGANGIINTADRASYGQWPPSSIGLVANAALLPTYTATGPVPTLSTESFPAPTLPTTINGGNGWFNPADNAKGIITVAGCQYPNAWDATAVPVPTATCTGTGAARRRAPLLAPVVTPML